MDAITTTNTRRGHTIPKPQDTPEQRIRRLTNAIGTGPHSSEIDVAHHLRTVLKSIGDRAALTLLEERKT